MLLTVNKVKLLFEDVQLILTELGFLHSGGRAAMRKDSRIDIYKERDLLDDLWGHMKGDEYGRIENLKVVLYGICGLKYEWMVQGEQNESLKITNAVPVSSQYPPNSLRSSLSKILHKSGKSDFLSYKSPRASGKPSAKLDSSVGHFNEEGIFRFTKKVEIRKMHMYYRLLADNRAKFVVKQSKKKKEKNESVEENQGQVQMNEELKEEINNNSSEKSDLQYPSQSSTKHITKPTKSPNSLSNRSTPENPLSILEKTTLLKHSIEKLKISSSPDITPEVQNLQNQPSSPKDTEQSQQDFSKINGVTRKTPSKITPLNLEERSSPRAGGSKEADSGIMPYLYVDVNITDSEMSTIEVFEGDQPEALAKEFALKHDLDGKTEEKLVDMLKAQMATVLCKIEEEENETNEDDSS